MPDDCEGIPEVQDGAVSIPVMLYSFTAAALRIALMWLTQASNSSNLMLPDDFKNLGFAEGDKVVPIPGHAGGATARSVRDDGKKIT